MLSKSIALGALCVFSVNGMAKNEQDALDNLRTRMIPLKSESALIQSFSTHKQSYIYDQALAIIALSKSHDQKSAKALLKGLSEIQLSDGSLYFSYNLDGSSPYPLEGDRRFAGAIAWVAIAATHYQEEFKSTEFKEFNERILKWMSSEIKPILSSKKNLKALRFSPSDIKTTGWNESEVAALEHNLDAYAAFRNFTKLNQDTKWKSEVSHLKDFILTMWDSHRSHFWSGINMNSGEINRDEIYLDNQTWSILALDDLKEIDPKKALSLNCDSLSTEHNEVHGFLDSKPTRGPKKYNFVWSEGTFGQILAMEKVGSRCGDKKASDYLISLKKMKMPDGGIAYATSSKNPDFTTASSVAGTAWHYFANKGINPFSSR